MVFFEYYSIVSEFMGQDSWVGTPFLVGALCFALVFVFQGVALFTIAGREGYKNRWMAFVPFFNTYYIGVCAQRNRVFNGVDTKILAMIAAIVEAVLFVGYLVYYVAVFQLINAGCTYWAEEQTVFGTIETLHIHEYKVTQNLKWAQWCFNYLFDYILWWAEYVLMFLNLFVLLSFFRTYSARRSFIFTLTSLLLPIQGILFFAVRNNRGLSFRDYVRAEQAKQYDMYRRANNMQNPYDDANGQNGGGYDSYGTPHSEQKSAPDDPFSEFDSAHRDDPFG